VVLNVLPPGFFVEEALAEDRPAIQVKFHFQGPFLELLSEEVRAKLKMDTECEIRELANARYGFLNWTVESPSPTAPCNQPILAEPGVPLPLDEAIAWHVYFEVDTKMVDTESGGKVQATIGTLKHIGRHANGNYIFEQTPDLETIYTSTEPVPFDDPVAIGDDLKNQVKQQLAFLLVDEKVKNFIKSIPIAKRLIADADNSRLLVPLKVKELGTGWNSILRVQIRSQNEIGNFDLKTASAVPENEEYGGFVRGQIGDISVPSVNREKPVTPWWDSELISIMGLATDINVYMETYNASLVPDVVVVDDDGVITDPEL